MGKASSRQRNEANKRFWNFQNQANNSTAELTLYGEISQSTWWGDEVTPNLFKEDLDKCGNVNTIVVHINSGGGDIFAAQAIGNMLEQHPAHTIAKNEGMCGSAAMTIAYHCDKFQCAEDSEVMIHLPEVGVCDYLDEVDLGRLLNAVKTIKENIVGLYARKTGKPVEDVAALVEATTWWTGKQAVENGFADGLIETGKKTVMENRNGYLFVNSVYTGMPVDEAPESLRNRLAEQGDFENKNPAMPEQHGEDTNMAENTEQTTIETVDDLRAGYPELVNSLEQETRTQAAQQAIQQEQERIRAIDEIAPLFPKELVQAAKYGENACNAQELSYRAAVDAQKHGRKFANDLAADAADSGANKVGNTPPADQHVKDDANLSGEERMTRARAAVAEIMGKKKED
jgi:ATP-dependent protease ClpP protease subunit/molybdopterin converting factor small subunit